MLRPPTLARHNTFPLETVRAGSATVSAMTGRMDNPIVAVVDDDASILRSLEYLLESENLLGTGRLFLPGKD